MYEFKIVRYRAIRDNGTEIDGYREVLIDHEEN